VPNLPMCDPEQLGDPQRPPNLSTFENLMAAMDLELRGTQSTRESRKGKGRAPVSSKPLSDMSSLDGDASDEAELQGALKQDADSEDESMKPSEEYNLIKNFLQSYTAQDGLSGPVSNMVGRLNEGSSRDI